MIYYAASDLLLCVIFAVLDNSNHTSFSKVQTLVMLDVLLRKAFFMYHYKSIFIFLSLNKVSLDFLQLFDTYRFQST
jgi:hypothetical protein